MGDKFFVRPLNENSKDLKDPKMWRGVLAEAIGTMLLVFIGCGSCLGKDGKDWETFSPTQVQISLTFGLAVATIVWSICHVSGGHINPAVTVAMLVTRKITIARALLYVTAQCVGAVAGAAILMGVSPTDVHGNLGSTTFHPHMTMVQAFGVELIITFVLVLTVFSSVDVNRTDIHGSSPLSIGLSVCLCHLFAIKYTGSSMNPARSFGPVAIAGSWRTGSSDDDNDPNTTNSTIDESNYASTLWDHHWIYWCAPIVGGIMAGLLYEAVFAKNASAAKIKNFLSTSKYNSDQVAEQKPELKMAERDERV